MILAAFERRPLPLRLFLLFALALAARLLYGLWLVGPTSAADTPLFHEHALRLLAGQGYGLPDRPPAFPFAMALVLRLFGGYPASVVVYQCVLSALVPPLLYLAGRALFGERAATLAGGFLVVHYPLVDYVRFVQSDIQFAFTVAATAWALSSGPAWRRVLLGGLLLGLSALTRGTALAFFPFILLLGATPLGPRAARLFFATPRPTLPTPHRPTLPAGPRPAGRASAFQRANMPAWTARAAHAALVVAVAGLVLLPWIVRNAREYGTFVPVSSEGGLNFFQGASVHYLFTGQTDLALAREATGWASGNNDELIRPENQAALMGYWWRLWREQPRLQVLLRAVSFVDFWSPVERVRDYALGPGNIYWAITYGALLPFFALGAWRILRRRAPETYFLLAAIAGAALLHTLTHAEQTRYRGLSVEPLIVLIAMYGVVAWRRKG